MSPLIDSYKFQLSLFHKGPQKTELASHGLMALEKCFDGLCDFHAVGLFGLRQERQFRERECIAENGLQNSQMCDAEVRSLLNVGNMAPADTAQFRQPLLR